MDGGLSSSPMPSIITASKAGIIHAETYKIVSADCHFMYGFCILQDLTHVICHFHLLHTRNMHESVCTNDGSCIKKMSKFHFPSLDQTSDLSSRP